MSAINQEDIFLILKVLEESPFDELQLDTGNIRLHVKKKGGFQSLANIEKNDTSSGKTPDIPASGRAPIAPEGVPVPPGEKGMEGFLAIKAPMLGTFYRTPKPGAPPFVEVGAMVDTDDPVCIIEVMKLFNTVKAGVKGRIARICAEQGQLVEYQQVLFLVEKIEAKGSRTAAKK